jgi:hypothetical protein
VNISILFYFFSDNQLQLLDQMLGKSHTIVYLNPMTRSFPFRQTKLRATFSLVAVCFLLLASVGIPLSQHWCGGKVVSARLYGHSASCGMMDRDASRGHSLSAPPCCNNVQSLQAATGLENDGVAAPLKTLAPEMVIQIISAVVPVSGSHHPDVAYRTGSPPGTLGDIIVFSHSYLI